MKKALLLSLSFITLSLSLTANQNDNESQKESETTLATGAVVAAIPILWGIKYRTEIAQTLPPIATAIKDFTLGAVEITRDFVGISCHAVAMLGALTTLLRFIDIDTDQSYKEHTRSCVKALTVCGLIWMAGDLIQVNSFENSAFGPLQIQV